MRILLFFLLGINIQFAIAGNFISNDVENKSWYLFKLEEKIPQAIEALTENDLGPIFETQDPTSLCEATIIQKIVTRHGSKNLIPVLIQSRKLDLIDDVVLDILYPIAFKFGKSANVEKSELKIESGSQKLSSIYKSLFSANSCSVDTLIQLENEVSKNTNDLPDDFMSFLHQWAKDKKLISQEQLHLANAISENLPRILQLRLKDYALKRETKTRKRPSRERKFSLHEKGKTK